MKKVCYLLAILILLFSSNSFATTDAKAASKEKLEVHKTVLQLDCIAVAVISNKNLVNLSMENKYSFNVSKDTPFMYTEAGPIDLDILKLIKPRKRDTHIFTTKESTDSTNWCEDHYKNHVLLASEMDSDFIINTKTEAIHYFKGKEVKREKHKFII